MYSDWRCSQLALTKDAFSTAERRREELEGELQRLRICVETGAKEKAVAEEQLQSSGEALAEARAELDRAALDKRAYMEQKGNDFSDSVCWESIFDL